MMNLRLWIYCIAFLCCIFFAWHALVIQILFNENTVRTKINLINFLDEQHKFQN